MNEEIKELLNEEIKGEIQSLASMANGSEEKSAAIEDLAKLYKLGIEGVKTAEDDCMRKKQLAEQVKDRYFRVGTAAVELVLPLIFYAVWMKRGFKFEETGTFTSSTFRGLFNRFRPTKK